MDVSVRPSTLQASGPTIRIRARRLELLRFAPPMEGTGVLREVRTMQESKGEGYTLIRGIKRR